jgi:hypothetical protein
VSNKTRRSLTDTVETTELVSLNTKAKQTLPVGKR